MFFIMKFIVIALIYSSLINADQWFSKSQCTQKEFANHMEINCEENQWILIGWSHYGTKKEIERNRTTDEHRCEPTPTDCIMDYTHKIAELCNGMSRCEVILTQQFIHKCSDEANYLFISYQCVQNSTIVDICSERSVTSSSSIHLISPSFPNEYPNNINCTCQIQSNDQSSTNVIIDVENFSFHLQDNDRLNSLSGTYPFGSSLFVDRNQLNLRFQTDETLSQSGFWIRFEGHHQCHDDEQSLGSKCLKIFVEKQNYQTAVEQCLALNSNLIQFDDIIEEKKLTHFFSTYRFDEKISIWISNNPDVHSWWPWRSSTDQGACVLRTIDGWFHRSCDEEHSFICQRNLRPISIPLTLRCGQPSTTTSTSTTTTTAMTTTTMTMTTSFLPIRPLLLKEKSTEKTTVEPRTNSIDPNLLATILGGVALLIFLLNIIVCFLCRREHILKPKVSNESQSSLTHEDFQHSLMQHLYNEQMNTISSTSSKQSQSKSNETTTSHVQLSSTNLPSLPLEQQRVEYHFYETIPSDLPSAFKPVRPSSNYSSTLRPHYHPRSSYDTLTHHPVCCFHQINSHVLPSTDPPSSYLVGSESIV